MAEPRAQLSREQVLRTAVGYADAHGMDSLSMRTLARELGVVPMALYKHVADKEDLLDGMVDALITEFDLGADATSGDWQAQVRALALAARATVTRHPWARGAIESRTRRTPAVLGHMERVLGCLISGGVSVDLAHHAMHALGNRIWGFSPELFNASSHSSGRRTEPGRSTAGEPDPRDYPAIMAVAEDARARRPEATGCAEDYEFVFALDLMLDGVERLRREGWESRP